MEIRTNVWYDLVNAKMGDEYLALYIGRQREIRKWFKILTILLSANGIWSALKDFSWITIASCVVIAIVQFATSIENFIIHSENDIQKLGNLRLLYYDRTNKLEELWYKLQMAKVTESEAADIFFNFRDRAKEIEQLDNELNIRKFKGLYKKADVLTRNYLNSYLND
jgi:hypothetical protein